MIQSILLRLVHVTANLYPKAGGPSRTVMQLVDALATGEAVEVTLLCQGFSDEPTVSSVNQSVNRQFLSSPSALSLKLGLPVNHWAAWAARRYDIRLIIHPRGMLEPWALKQQAFKKRLALELFQRRDLETAKAFIATAKMEYKTIRTLGLKQPVAIIPNGVSVEGSPGEDSARSTNEPEIRTALFLSRVHPKKGIPNLLRAWAQVAPQGWRLRIAGPDEGEHLAEVMALARQLGIEQFVEYVGAVDGPEKSALYRDGDLFVLPTFSENFGVVVAEALAHGVPVITTKGAPWKDLETYECGWWIDIGIEPLVSALRAAMALSNEER